MATVANQELTFRSPATRSPCPPACAPQLSPIDTPPTQTLRTSLTRFLLMAFLALGRFIPTTTIPETQARRGLASQSHSRRDGGAQRAARAWKQPTSHRPPLCSFAAFMHTIKHANGAFSGKSTKTTTKASYNYNAVSNCAFNTSCAVWGPLAWLGARA